MVLSGCAVNWRCFLNLEAVLSQNEAALRRSGVDEDPAQCRYFGQAKGVRFVALSVCFCYN